MRESAACPCGHGTDGGCGEVRGGGGFYPATLHPSPTAFRPPLSAPAASSALTRPASPALLASIRSKGVGGPYSKGTRAINTSSEDIYRFSLHAPTCCDLSSAVPPAAAGGDVMPSSLDGESSRLKPVCNFGGGKTFFMVLILIKYR